MKALSGLLAACALALASPSASADAKALAGVWLFEPLYFDEFVDQGLVTPEYPVLVVHADGRFTLYRVVMHCDMLENEPGKVDDAACRRALERSRADLGTLAAVSAAGKWQIAADGRVMFSAQERGRTPPYFQRYVDAFRKDAAEIAAKLEKEARDEFSRQRVRDALKLQVQRMENFYSTAYVLDGAPVKFTRDGEFLRLEGEAQGDQLVYRAIEPRLLQGAAGFIPLADLSAVRYFRCVVDYFQRTPTDPLVDIAREASSAKLRSHAVAAPLRDGKPGAYLGCPARDQM